MERSRSEVQLDFMFGLGCGPCKLTVLLVWVKIRCILTGKINIYFNGCIMCIQFFFFCKIFFILLFIILGNI